MNATQSMLEKAYGKNTSSSSLIDFFNNAIRGLNEIINNFAGPVHNISMDTSSSKDKPVIENKEIVNVIYDCIFVDGKKIKFNKPIIFKQEINNDGIFLINTTLNIYAGGSTLEEAKKDMYNEVKIQYQLYAHEDDNNLNENAKDIKKQLLESISFLE